MRIVLVGSIGRFPLAGHAWINLQYLLGFRALGHDVFYLEDAGEHSYVYHWEEQQLTSDLDYPARCIHDALDPLGLVDCWSYRTSHEHRGVAPDAVREQLSAADLLLVRGAPLPMWREEYRWPQRRAFLDVDPLFTQVAAINGDSLLNETIEQCDVLLTIGQRLGKSDCTIPDLGRPWHKTVSPIFLPAWPGNPEPPSLGFTTIMQWAAYKSVTHAGVEYGNKTIEFPRFVDVAGACDESFCIAMSGRPPENVDTTNWRLVDGMDVSTTLSDYQHFIQQSRGEFSVAKHGYVASRGGWFSDRTVCYLASGRPAIVQDTGLRDWLACNEGLLTFTDVNEAVAAVESVCQDYKSHSQAARALAERCFSTDVVLTKLLESVLTESSTAS